MRLMTTLLHVLGRAVLAALGATASIFFAMLSGFFGGGSGSDGLALSAAVSLFALGWALLPAVRESRLLAVAVLLGWAYIAFRLSQFGMESAKGWLLGPWVLATLGLVFCLIKLPPKYLSRPAESGQTQPHDES